MILGAVGCYPLSLNCVTRLRYFTIRADSLVTSQNNGVFRLRKLEQLDEELRKGDEKAALSIVRDLQGKTGGLRGFGAARQVPQRLYTLDELKLNGIDTSSFLAPSDKTLGSIERNLQIAAVLIYFNGGVMNLLLDTIGHTISKKYHNRVIQHEAGHFLTAYMLGVLPKGYTITSLETLKKEASLNVQAGTAFVDYEFVEEVDSGKVSSKMLNRFSCIALAGVATEYLLYGYSEGGLADIAKLDGLLKGLGFTQKKADSQVRWAVLNTILILRRHEKARSRLAEAMSIGKSVGSCINDIEDNISPEDI